MTRASFPNPPKHWPGAWQVSLPAPSTETSTFHYTGAVQTWTVPVGVTSATFDLTGGAGGSGGKGARVIFTAPVTPGEVVDVYVGGQGNDTVFGILSGGFNGGGGGPGYGSPNRAYAGGGGTDVRHAPYGLANRFGVAGGGGGSGSTAVGGDAGFPAGVNGATDDQGHGGAGGTQSTGFALGQGGSGTSNISIFVDNGGGGGGGYWGGLGGGSSGFGGGGGGGGSSWTDPAATGVTHIPAASTGPGVAVITYSKAPTGIDVCSIGEVIVYAEPHLAPTPTDQKVFLCTGAPQQWTMPFGITNNMVRFVVEGAEGGPQESSSGTGPSHPPGKGGIVTCDDVVLTPGETLGIYVGCPGGNGPTGAGFNGGGSAGDTGGGFNGGGGGGGSDIRRGGTDLAHRVVAAGGGGGHAAVYDPAGGGDGDWPTGGAGYDLNGNPITGQGGTQSLGGVSAPTGQAGALGQGGNSPNAVERTGGGGGGGYYGGGSGATGYGGGGGSSWGGIGTVSYSGYRVGGGRITISWNTGPATNVFRKTGNIQFWTVPIGVTRISIDSYGCHGSDNVASTKGGNGGRVHAQDISVTPGEVLQILIGLDGGAGGGGSSPGGDGGGSAQVRRTPYAITNALTIAAGGGGSGGGGRGIDHGGDGGYTTGSSPPTGEPPATGGSQTAGGKGGGWFNTDFGGDGAQGQGGAGMSWPITVAAAGGGGGGGGWYGGGGGGQQRGGAGGSSYEPGNASTVVFETGTGPDPLGYVEISWAPTVPTAAQVTDPDAWSAALIVPNTNLSSGNYSGVKLRMHRATGAKPFWADGIARSVTLAQGATGTKYLVASTVVGTGAWLESIAAGIWHSIDANNGYWTFANLNASAAHLLPTTFPICGIGVSTDLASGFDGVATPGWAPDLGAGNVETAPANSFIITSDSSAIPPFFFSGSTPYNKGAEQ